MSDEERWLYEEAEKGAKGGHSGPGVIVSMREETTYRFADGRAEAVDLSRVGVYDLCCPHIRDLLGAAVLKLCELQPVTHSTRDGQVRSFAQCGPLAYINKWKICPYRSAKEKEGGV